MTAMKYSIAKLYPFIIYSIVLVLDATNKKVSDLLSSNYAVI